MPMPKNEPTDLDDPFGLWPPGSAAPAYPPTNPGRPFLVPKPGPASGSDFGWGTIFGVIGTVFSLQQQTAGPLDDDLALASHANEIRNCDPKCRKLLAEMYETMNVIEGRINALLYDLPALMKTS